MRFVKLHLNTRVCIVSMNGCMAQSRGNLREGTVTGIIYRKVYGDTKERPYAQIRLDNGDLIEKCGESRLWTKHNGLPEYQE